MGNSTFTGAVRSEGGFQTVSKNTTTGAVSVVSNVGGGMVANAAASLTVTAALHAGKTIKTDKADGSTLTLPAATGTGAVYRFFTGTTITSVGLVIQVANATDVMAGRAYTAADGGNTIVAFETAATSDTMTMDGSTTGGLYGDMIEIQDVASGVFAVTAHLAGTGVEATPFSAAVS